MCVIGYMRRLSQVDVTYVRKLADHKKEDSATGKVGQRNLNRSVDTNAISPLDVPTQLMFGSGPMSALMSERTGAIRP